MKNKCTILNLILIFVIQMVLNILAFAFWPDNFHFMQNVGIFTVQVILNITPWILFDSLAESEIVIEFPIKNWENND